jgi:hypothetical protein
LNIFIGCVFAWYRKKAKKNVLSTENLDPLRLFSASGSSKHTTRYPTTPPSLFITITCPVHPWVTEEVILISEQKDKVWIENENGEMRILPKNWTSLLPQMDPPRIDDHLVRLDLSRILELSKWIESRKHQKARSSRIPYRGQSKNKAHHTQGSKKKDEHILKRRDQ